MINVTLDLHGCICGAVVQIILSTAANMETIYIKVFLKKECCVLFLVHGWMVYLRYSASAL